MERKKFLLRLPVDLWDELQRLAASDLRSVNVEIEVLLREALQRRGIKTDPTKSETSED